MKEAPQKPVRFISPRVYYEQNGKNQPKAVKKGLPEVIFIGHDRESTEVSNDVKPKARHRQRPDESEFFLALLSKQIAWVRW